MQSKIVSVVGGGNRAGKNVKYIEVGNGMGQNCGRYCGGNAN